MSYNSNQYGRPIAAPQQGVPAQINPYQAQNPYQQQFFYNQQGQQFIQIQPNMGAYQLMAYPQQQAQHQPNVFVTDESYNTLAQVPIAGIPPGIRFQPQQNPQLYADPRRKKSETIQPQVQMQTIPVQPPTIIPTQIPATQVPVSKYPQQQIQPAQTIQIPKQQVQNVQQQNSLSLLSDAQLNMLNFIQNEKPPGCFNIIRRGNLPSMVFQQICVP